MNDRNVQIDENGQLIRMDDNLECSDRQMDNNLEWTTHSDRWLLGRFRFIGMDDNPEWTTHSNGWLSRMFRLTRMDDFSEGSDSRDE